MVASDPARLVVVHPPVSQRTHQENGEDQDRSGPTARTRALSMERWQGQWKRIDRT